MVSKGQNLDPFFFFWIMSYFQQSLIIPLENTKTLEYIPFWSLYPAHLVPSTLMFIFKPP